MTLPRLSIISPVLNGDKYLRAFIQSVIDQHCSKIEHILVDGGSQDHSVEVLEEFSRTFAHIRWIGGKDSGPAEAINKGIAMARGTFISILCLNDFYEPNTLNEVVELLPTLVQPAFLVGNCNILNEYGELLYINKPTALTPVGIFMKKPFPYNPSAYFYHKDLHQRVGLYDSGPACDLDFLLRVFSVAHVHYVDKSWGNFRLMPDSITVRAQQTGQLERWKEEILQRHLKKYSMVQRSYIQTVIFLRRQQRLVYYLKRIKYYLLNPKVAMKYLIRIFNQP